MFSKLSFLFAARGSNKDLASSIDLVLAHGGTIIQKLPAHEMQRDTVLCVGDPRECFNMVETHRKSTGTAVPCNVLFVRPAFIWDCHAQNTLLSVDDYVVFRKSPDANREPRSSRATRGPHANEDWQALELAIAVEMHRVANAVKDEIEWRSLKSAGQSRSSSCPDNWIGRLDSRLNEMIELGQHVVEHRS